MIEQIGKHRVSHGDVMLGIDNLMQGQKAYIFNSDPPWGEGNLKYWQTINKKQTGAMPKEVNHDNFLNQIFSLSIKHTTDDAIIFITYGIRWKDQIKKLGEKYGLIHNGIGEAVYSSKFLPLHIHIFSKKQITLPKNYLEQIKGTRALETLRKSINPFTKPNTIMLDPCCGMGYTAQIAKENNMIFYGNELNKSRLEKTKIRLRK